MKKNRGTVWLIVCLCWVMVLPSMTFGADKDVGIALGTGMGMSRDEALARALRNAVETAVGVMVSSDTLAENYQIVSDRIYTNVEGYVREFDVIEETKTADGLVQLTIRAVVEQKQLESDLKAIKLIKEAKGNPKTMVLIRESMDTEETGFSAISVTVEDFFRSKTFEMVDPGQMQRIQERDAYSADPVKAAALAKRFGAELLIAGSAKAHHAGTSTPYGVSVFAYSVTFTIKAIHADNADILASFTGTETGRAGSPGEAVNIALSSIWDEKKTAFFAAIMEKWRGQVMNTVEVTLIVANVAPEKRRGLKSGLEEVSGIQAINERSYTDGVIEFSLTVDGAAMTALEDNIYGKLPELILTGKTGHRLDYKMKDK